MSFGIDAYALKNISDRIKIIHKKVGAVIKKDSREKFFSDDERTDEPYNKAQRHHRDKKLGGIFSLKEIFNRTFILLPKFFIFSFSIVSPIKTI
ncbi:MAG: hypothetical protein ACLR06_14660 [Christensenellaceae bacterium]